MAARPIVWAFLTGIWVGMWIGVHAMTSYCLSICSGAARVKPGASIMSEKTDRSTARYGEEKTDDVVRADGTAHGSGARGCTGRLRDL